MKILIQSATLLDSKSPFHKKKKNVLITNGRITDISDKKLSAEKTIPAEGMLLTTGWCDIGSSAGDPGYEQKEDLASLARVAAAGGFTEVAIQPNTKPAIQTKNEVSFIRSGNENRLVQIYPMASVTWNNKGEELTDMIDLNQAGAIAFTDGLKSLWHTDIFVKALQYLQKFNGLLIDHPEDVWLNLSGQMHEGITSTKLGLKGMPRIAEELTLGRNLDLLRYAGGRLHVSRVSTAKSVDKVRAAKKRGLNITCDVVSYQSLLDNKLLEGFDTNFKVNPPLREKKDMNALLRGLTDGTIDVICSGHVPQDEESKSLEFDMAEFGVINLQTFAANLVQLSEFMKWELIVEKITRAPRALLGLEVPTIDVDQPANLTLLDPAAKWTLNTATNKSKSKNSPWWEKELVGKVIAVFNNGRASIDA